MALTQVTGPYPIFTDLDGTPLDDGYLYIGLINQDPEQNPIQVFWDSNLTIPATQPIRTSNGYAYRNGTPALIYTAGEFSITIRNKREEFVLYSPVGYGFDPAAVSASVVKNDFIGDGVEVDFTLSSAPSTILATNVFINGVYQEKDSYGLSGNVITFSIAPPLNSSIEIMTNETGVINGGNATAITYTLTEPGAVQQTVQTKLEQYISIKDFGAIGDGVADDTAAIQACLDAIQSSSALGGTAYIPAGEYKITATLDLPANVSMEGAGQFSILRVYGCDGINILSSNVIGPRRVANFWLYGSGADAFSAIVCDILPAPKAMGLLFDGVYISFFGTGVSGRGLWHTAFRNCVINQVHVGMIFYGQNVKITVDTCSVTHGGLVSGTGESVGIQVGDSGGSRPEDVQIDKTIVFGFDVGVVWRQCLFGGITNSDIDACQVEGVRITTADGGFVVRDNYIQVDSSTVNVIGINVAALGFTPALGTILIQNNRIGNTTNTAGASYGIFVGANQTGVQIDNNACFGWAAVGSFRADGAVNLKVTNNSFATALQVLNCVEPYVANNNIDGTAQFLSNTQPIFGRNQGVLTYAFGSVAIPAGATSATATWASLGLPNGVSGINYFATIDPVVATSRGTAWAVVTTTDITVYVQTSFGVPAGVSFSVQAF